MDLLTETITTQFPEYNKSNENDMQILDLNITPTLYVRTILAIFLRVGYILIQIGIIPTNSVNFMILQNLLDMCVATISYTLTGYLLQFSVNYKEYTGIKDNNWLLSNDVDMVKAITSWTVVMTTTGIITTMVAGRMHFFGHMILTAITAGCFQPIVMHLAWSPDGEIHRSNFQGYAVSYYDIGGAGVIHMLAGTVALYAGLFLGRRLLLRREIDATSLPIGAPGMVIVGYLFITFGFVAAGLPTPLYENVPLPGTYVGNIVMNNAVAVAGGVLTVTALQLMFPTNEFDFHTLLRCIQGGVAGMVMVSAGVDKYNLMTAYGLSVVAGIFFFLAARSLFLSPFEDYCNLVPIHLLCGFVGSAFPQLYEMMSTHDDLRFSYRNFTLLGWQEICSVTLLALYLLEYLPIFLLISYSNILRNNAETTNHNRASAVASRGPPRAFTKRLFTMQKHQVMLSPAYNKKEGPFQDSMEIRDIEMRYSSLANQKTVLSDIIAYNVTELKPDVKTTKSKPDSKPFKSRRPKFIRYTQLFGVKVQANPLPINGIDIDRKKQNNELDAGKKTDTLEIEAFKEDVQELCGLGDGTLPESQREFGRRKKKSVYTINGQQ